MRLDEAGGSGVPHGIVEVSFEQAIPEGLRRAVLAGLEDAPGLLARALHVAPPRRPYQRVEIGLQAGDAAQGEALALGAGSIRLTIGSSAAEARSIACHEALHLLLASALRGGEKWNDPELAFGDWIVRGIESGLDAPRFHAPLPEVVTRLPKSRREVANRLTDAEPLYFGEPLARALERESSAQRRLWLVEAALGVHHLEAAARLGEGALRAVILDDWLLDYEQYAHAVGNAPADAGNLWRLSDPGWSRDPLVRLSAAAQALQRDDRCAFAGEQFTREGEPLVWKNRGRVRLPLLDAPAVSRPPPIHGFRAALAGLDPTVVDDASRGEARKFEARALWPRILARLLATGVRPPDADADSVGVVQIADGEGADEAFHIWRDAADELRRIAGDCAPWVPTVVAPREIDAVASILLVHGAPPSAESILSSRRLAAQRPVRGTVFRDHLGNGRAWERLPDFEPPLDPRYRDDAWSAGPVPPSLAELPAAVEAATAKGRLTSPLVYLLSMMAFGVEECHYRVTGMDRR
ncbi:MAG: hypothetical protein ABR567_01960 [Myxococcales bacterium]|nr:hypothetical protein [Myxococcales bacterium]